jgi:hypoxanthine-guanine phosphoribosyltransferase
MKSSRKLNWMLFMGLTLGCVGCATTSPLLVPVRPSPVHTLAPPPPARLRIPLVVSLPSVKEMEEYISDFVKEDLKKEEQSLTKKLGTEVKWEPLDWKFENNKLTARMHVHYKNKKSSQDSDDESADQEVEKEVHSKVTSAIQWNKAWHLEAPDFEETAIEKGKNQAPTNTQTPEKDSRKSEKLLRKGTDQYNESLKKTTDIKAKIKEIWDQIQEPVEMSKNVWLQVLPDSFGVGSYRIIPDPTNPRMETEFELYAQPNVIFGGKPRLVKVEMPPLKDLKPGTEGFHIVTNLKIKFDEVNKLLTDPKTGIINKALPGSEDHDIELTNVRIYGSGGKIVVEAGIDYSPILNLSDKPAHLTVYLLGTPTYHEKTQVIDFPDMDFDIKSSDFLVQMVDFLDGDGMRDQLRKDAVIPVGKKLDTLKLQLNQMLNRPIGKHIVLKTTVTSLKMQEAFVTDYGIEGQVAMDGDASVNVTW